MYRTHENTADLTASERQIINDVRETVLEADPKVDAQALDAALEQFWRRRITKQDLFALVTVALNVRDGRIYH